MDVAGRGWVLLHRAVPWGVEVFQNAPWSDDRRCIDLRGLACAFPCASSRCDAKWSYLQTDGFYRVPSSFLPLRFYRLSVPQPRGYSVRRRRGSLRRVPAYSFDRNRECYFLLR